MSHIFDALQNSLAETPGFEVPCPILATELLEAAELKSAAARAMVSASQPPLATRTDRVPTDCKVPPDPIASIRSAERPSGIDQASQFQLSRFLSVLGFFGLRQQPFGVTPDSTCVFPSASWRRAWASLCYGIENQQGLIVLAAEPGMGKTTLLYRVLSHYKHSARTAFVFQTQCNSQQLLRYLLADLGFGCEEQDPVRLHERINEYLLQTAAEGKRSILVLDEAQNLSSEVLEAIRLLSDFETPRRKLLQIILAGQSELLEQLARPRLASLQQRITVSAALTALTTSEVEHYINHRLEHAGYAGLPLFTPDACNAIAKFTGGVPRRINQACWRALSIAWARERKIIDASIVLELTKNTDVGNNWFVRSLARYRRLARITQSQATLARYCGQNVSL